MKNNRSSSEHDALVNSSGWMFAIILLVLAAVAIFQVFKNMQSHLYEEFAALDINQVIR